MIRSYPKTDGEKLIGLAKFLRDTFPPWLVRIEPYMMFTKGEDKFVGWNDELSEDQVRMHTIHHPDILFFFNENMIVLELDGHIHDIKTAKTDERNVRYEMNNISYIVVNETDLKFELDLPISAKLSQEQINQEFFKKIKEGKKKGI